MQAEHPTAYIGRPPVVRGSRTADRRSSPYGAIQVLHRSVVSLAIDSLSVAEQFQELSGRRKPLRNPCTIEIFISLWPT